MIKKLLTVCVGLILGCFLYGQASELDYFRSVFTEPEVRTFIENGYTDIDVPPLTISEYDQVRSKKVGTSFYDPSFGRKWTFLFDGGHTIMNSERNVWNSDTTLFFLEAGTGSNYRKLALFDGESAEYIETITVSSIPKTGSSLPSLRWMPGNPDQLFYIHSNKIYSYSINQKTTEVFQVFASFSSTESKIAGGDGNEVDPNGDFLIGNKGADCFVYNFFEKKVVRIQDNERFYFEPTTPFPTMNLGKIDYAVAFAGYIFELDEDGGGTLIRDFNGSVKQSLYRRTPHMDPTYFKHNNQLLPGIWIRYNSADASYYSGKGLPSEEKRCYFHAFDPDQPGELIRVKMDSWPSANLGSGGQVSANRFGGTTGILNIHGPKLYDLPWEARFGEVYEKSLYDEDATMSRRIAHHYIAFEATYPSSSYQPEGWISPNGNFVIIKTYWGWYKVDLVTDRMSIAEVTEFLENPSPPTYDLLIENGRGGGEIIEGVVRTIMANEPATGMAFDKWTGDVEHINDINSREAILTMPSKNITLTAIYKAAEQFNLTISIEGTGSVATNPPGDKFHRGTPVALIPQGGTGTTFVRWEGDITGTQNPAVVIMDSSVHVTAIFSDATTAAPDKYDSRTSFQLAGYTGRDEVSFNICLPQSSPVSLIIYNIIGTKVFNKMIVDLPAGTSVVSCPLDNNEVAGLYIARLTHNRHVETLKFIKH